MEYKKLVILLVIFLASEMVLAQGCPTPHYINGYVFIGSNLVENTTPIVMNVTGATSGFSQSVVTSSSVGGFYEGIFIANDSCSSGFVEGESLLFYPRGYLAVNQQNLNFAEGRVTESFNLSAQILVCSAGCDYTNIQAALDAVSEGDTIYIYSGEYATSSTLQINTNNITLVGEDKEITILNYTGSGSDSLLKINSDYVTLNNLKFVNSPTVSADTTIKIFGSHTKIINCVFRSKSGTNIPNMDIRGNPTDINISSNDIVGGYYGIELAGSTQNYVANNIISNVSYVAIFVMGDGQIINNTITNSTRGIRLRSLSTGLITDNDLSQNNYGIEISSSVTYTNFTRNTILDSTSYDIFSDQATSIYNNIYNNSFCSSFFLGDIGTISDNTCSLNPPIVELVSPSDGNTTMSSNVSFSYTPSDETPYTLVTIVNCLLYSNFSGSWGIKQTSTNISNNVTNYFNVSFADDGIFLWNVECVDRDGNAAMASSNWTVSLSIPQEVTNLVINEFLPHPSRTGQEWIEVYNPTNSTVDLWGYVLDDIADGGSSTYTIPNGSTILANNFTVFYKNDTNITLGDLGDTVRLITNLGTIVDNFAYYYSMRGISIGRETDGAEEWTTFELPTPGLTNAGVNDTNPPSISLDSPADESTDMDGNVFLVYLPTDQSLMSNCMLYTNVTGTWQIYGIDTTVLVNARNSFGLFGLANGTYLWNVQCTDDTSLSASAPRSQTFIVNKTADIIFNQALNLTLNEIMNVASSETNVSLEINVTENVTDAYISIASYSNNTRNVSLSVTGLNRFITIETSTELEESMSNFLLRIYYTDAEVTTAGLNETGLGIWWYNESLNTWQILNENTMDWVYATGVNTTANFLWANIAHFSHYTIGEGAETYSIPLALGWNIISIPLIQ